MVAVLARRKRKKKKFKGWARRQGTMGAFMSEPITEKTSEDGENDVLVYGASEMQGWRKNHEDAHTCTLLQSGPVNRAVFGVWDEHGGKEVSTVQSIS